MVHNNNTVPLGAQESLHNGPVFQDPGMQAGLPAAIQAVRQTGERGQNCTASDDQLPGPQKKKWQRQEKRADFLIIIWK